MILGFWAWDLVFGNLSLEFSRLRVRVWHSVLGLVIWWLLVNVLEFLFLSLGFWERDLEFIVSVFKI